MSLVSVADIADLLSVVVSGLVAMVWASIVRQQIQTLIKHCTMQRAAEQNQVVKLGSF